MDPSAALPTAAQERLRLRGERGTPAREAVLDILLAAPAALTHQEIEHAARGRGLMADRVTLYRVLDWLVAKGLAHKIAGEDRVWRFNAVDQEGHGHAHFHCTGCGQVYCLDDLRPSFALALPPGYRFEHAELTIQGLCPRCNV
jgi:Fur family ferric uptake transcriptional regulator